MTTALYQIFVTRIFADFRITSRIFVYQQSYSIMKKLLLFIIPVVSFFVISPAVAHATESVTFVQDTLINFDDVIFTDGTLDEADTAEGELLELQDDGVASDGQEEVATFVETEPMDGAPQSLWAIFIAGIIGGFAAFLMPCIYPMVPLTVSYF